ncbi:MAG: hypothetical protein WDW19_00570 [Neisseriaceae bacterium]
MPISISSVRCVSLIIISLLCVSFGYANQAQDEIRAVQKFSKFDQQCAKFNRAACQTLLNNLGTLCKKNNSFACFRIGEIATINSEVAAKQALKADAVKWLDVAVGSTKKSCQLKLRQACTQMQKFKTDFQKACKKGDQFFCKASKTL